MLKRKLLLLAAASLVGAPLLLAGVGHAAASPTPTPGSSAGSLSDNYYSNAGGSPDGTVRIVNNSGASKCANIYVTNEDQEMRECCACPVTDKGELILSVNHDLTSNPANGVPTTNGSVAILSSGPSCGDPGSSKTHGVPQLSGYETHPDEATGLLTEEEFTPLLGTAAAIADLQAECAAIELIGSGTGVCTCGSSPG